MIQSLRSLGNRVGGYLGLSGYDAVDQDGKRRSVSSLLKSEDQHLKPQDARKVIASARDLTRNFSLVGWVIRQHLNYLTEFNFQSYTGNEDFDKQFERQMEIWSRPANCDASGRFCLADIIRMTEKRMVVDGGIAHLKLSDGTLQPIEADRIRNPDQVGTENWVNGFRINNQGRVMAMAIHRRSGSVLEYEKTVLASQFMYYANYERFDQVVGISPIVAAINSFKDVYEAIDLSLAKLKVEQLFALAITRDSSSSTGEVERRNDGGYDTQFGKGPIQLDMDPGDDAKFLKSDNPGAATQEFIKLVIRLALTSLDLPYGLFDTGDTNFFGGKAGFMVYERSLIAKIRKLQDLLRKITLWKLRQWVIDGVLTLPDGMTVGDIAFEWVHRGMPWWDQSKEIDGDLAAIQAGLTDPYTVCKKRDLGDWEENVLRTGKALKFAESNGVPISFNRSGMRPVDAPQNTQNTGVAV